MSDSRSDAAVTGRPRVDMAVHPPHELYAPGGEPGADGGHEVRAVVEIGARGLGSAAPHHTPKRSEVIIIDCSGSMGHPGIRKIAAARKAAAAAVEMLPDGTHFALVAGTDTARVVYPWGDPDTPAAITTVAASAASRAEGRRAALTLEAHGGTRISAWLSLARRLLTARPDATFRHALLLTDGRDEHGRAEELRRVLDECAGEFTCDALGIGEDWDAVQLQRIAGRLRGRVEAVGTGDGEAPHGGQGPGAEPGAEPGEGLEEQLTRLFRELVGASTRRTLPQLTLGVRPGPHLAVTSFRQLNPTELDLTDTAVRDGDRTLFPTGAWGDEKRWYELGMRVDPAHPGPRQARAARIATVWLEAGEPGEPEEGGGHGGNAERGDVLLPRQQAVTARWTGESPPLTDLGAAGRHFQRCAELGEAMRAGAAALGRGDHPLAERELGRAVRLAHELGDESKLEQLRTLVVVEDAAQGQVRARGTFAPGNLQTVIAMSSHTLPPPDASEPAPDGPHSLPPPVRCPDCAEQVQPGKYCENCGRPLRKEP